MTFDELLSKEPLGYHVEFSLFSRDVQHRIYHNPGARFATPGWDVASRGRKMGEHCKKFHFRTWEEVINHIQNYDPNGTVKPVEIQPMKITLTYEELQKILETHMSEKVLKAPVTIDELTVLSEADNPGTLAPIEWDNIEFEVKPKESAK